MKGQLLKGIRKPLQIEIVEDDIFDRHRTSREPKEEMEEEPEAHHKIMHEHRLSPEMRENISEESEESSFSQEKPKGKETFRESDMNTFEGTERLEGEDSSPTLKYRVQLLEQQLRKQKREKDELYAMLKDMSRKKQELDCLYEEENNRTLEMEQLHTSMNKLKQINRRLEEDLRQQREYSKKLEEEIKDAMNYKNTGLKVQSYLQRRNNENREAGNIKVKDGRGPRGSKGQF